jgi:N4-gp56 family major capsid protein
MVDTPNTYAELTQEELGYARGKALKRAQKRLLVSRYGQVDPQPLNATRTRMWTRWNRPAIPSGPIAEGQSPKGQKVTSSIVQVTLNQYGAVIPFTDRQIKNSREQIIANYSEVAGEQAAICLETNDLAALKAGTNAAYAGTSATGRTSVAAPPTAGALKVLTRALVNQGASKVTKMIKPGVFIATEGVPAAFIAFCHPDLQADIEDMRGFTPPEKYAQPGQSELYEIGRVGDVRFIGHDLLTPYYAGATGNASQTTFLTSGTAGTGSADVYPVLLFGQDAYATVPLAENRPRRGVSSDDAAIKLNVVMPKPQHGDELGLNGFISWLADHACAILNQAWILRWEVACTAVPD